MLRQQVETHITRPLERRVAHQLEGRLMGAMLDVSRITNDGSYSGLRSRAQAGGQAGADAEAGAGGEKDPVKPSET